MVKMLIEYGADVNARGADNKRPINVINGNYEISSTGRAILDLLIKAEP